MKTNDLTEKDLKIELDSLKEQFNNKKYDELFSPFNLNLSKKSFWKKGLNVIESLIDELETL